MGTSARVADASIKKRREPRAPCALAARATLGGRKGRHPTGFGAAPKPWSAWGLSRSAGQGFPRICGQKATDMIDMLSASDSSPYCTARAAAATAGESGDYGGRATESYKTAAIFSDCAPQLLSTAPSGHPLGQSRGRLHAVDGPRLRDAHPPGLPDGRSMRGRHRTAGPADAANRLTASGLTASSVRNSFDPEPPGPRRRRQVDSHQRRAIRDPFLAGLGHRHPRRAGSTAAKIAVASVAMSVALISQDGSRGRVTHPPEKRRRNRRRGGDSNPRTRSTPVTRFPVAPVQPLRHLSSRPAKRSARWPCAGRGG